MAGRIGGKNFDIALGLLTVHVETATLNIEDSSAVAKTQGVPNGHVDGEVAASGELVVDAQNLNLIMMAAAAAGSFRGLEPFDLHFFAVATGGETLVVEAFGCKLQVSALLNITATGGEKHTTTIPFFVTSPDFVRINGIPYLKAAETLGLIG